MFFSTKTITVEFGCSKAYQPKMSADPSANILFAYTYMVIIMTIFHSAVMILFQKSRLSVHKSVRNILPLLDLRPQSKSCMSADKSTNTLGRSALLQPNSTVIVLVLKNTL